MLLFSCSIMSDSLWPHGLQHARLPCPSLFPRACSKSFPLCQWCHPTILSSVVPFFCYPQSFPASGAFLRSWLFTSGGKYWSFSFSVSTPNELSALISFRIHCLISLQSKGLSRVFSNTKVWKHQFLGIQFSLWSNSHIHTWPLEKP